MLYRVVVEERTTFDILVKARSHIQARTLAGKAAMQRNRDTFITEPKQEYRITSIEGDPDLPKE
jgi:hypothetical protein